MKEWLKNNASPVDKEDMERHDKWLCMMWPRLQLLRELLSDDGVIFVSIDDNEVHHLINLLCEAFGENNLIATCPVVSNLKGNQDQFGFAGTHEYLVVFAKNKPQCKIIEYKISDEDLDVWNEDEIGFYKKGAPLRATGEDALREKRPYMFYPIFIKNDQPTTVSNVEYSKIYDKDTGIFDDKYLKTLIEKYEQNGFETILPKDEYGRFGRWRWGYRQDNINRISYDIMFFKGKDGYSLYKKQRPQLGELPSNKQKTLFYKPEYSTTSGKNEIKGIFLKNINLTTKASCLIKDILKISTNPNDIILDSFAGSGTTGHATLALNKEDGGNRKFILVEMEDYANHITAERVRRVIDGVPDAKDNALKAGLGGSFAFCELGDEFDIEKILNGEKLPSYASLASYVFYTATGKTLDGVIKSNNNYFIGETELYDVYMIYKDDLAFLRSNDSALNEEKLKIIANHNPNSKKQKIVFATAKYMSQDALKEHRVIYCNIPHAIHKIAGN